MKYHLLEAFARRAASFDFITKAYRIGQNQIALVFTNKHESATYIFDMTRGHSFIYKADIDTDYSPFHAPFDKMLQKYLEKSKIERIWLDPHDRVLHIEALNTKSYKQTKAHLQLEFTGKHANAILLDSKGVIIEALRHVGSDQSFRMVRPGIALPPLPPPKKMRGSQEPVDPNSIDDLLQDKWQQKEARQLELAKEQKCKQVQKKLDAVTQKLTSLPHEEEMAQKAKHYELLGNIVLANLYRIKPHEGALQAHDFEGNPVTIELPKDVTKSRLAEHFFTLSKRAKNKAKHTAIEKEQLEHKRRFLQHLYQALKQATTLEELELLLPKQKQKRQRQGKDEPGEHFFIEGYKVMVGKSAKENMALLQCAKANDIWMHAREYSGAHLIIRTDKKEPPASVLRKAAKLCVDFTAKGAGSYTVDYTKRKFVKTKEGGLVEYDKYKTIRIQKA